MKETVKVEIQSSGTKLRRPPRRPAAGKLKSERVEEMLKAMPGWSLSPEGAAIQCTRKFPTARVAGLFAGYVADFASSRRQGAHVMLSGRQVVVALPGAPLRNGRFGGITEAVFALAQQLG
jgi:pterin-4a-carbinolamine dehydratase